MPLRHLLSFVACLIPAAIALTLFAAAIIHNSRPASVGDASPGPYGCVAPDCLTQPPDARWDRVRIAFASREYRALQTMRRRLAASRSMDESQIWWGCVEQAKHAYFLCYIEITPAGRRKAGLPEPGCFHSNQRGGD